MSKCDICKYSNYRPCKGCYDFCQFELKEILYCKDCNFNNPSIPSKCNKYSKFEDACNLCVHKGHKCFELKEEEMENEYLTPGQAVDAVLAGERVEVKHNNQETWADVNADAYGSLYTLRDITIASFSFWTFRRAKLKKKWVDCTWWEAAEHDGNIKSDGGFIYNPSEAITDATVAWYIDNSPWQKEVEE